MKYFLKSLTILVLLGFLLAACGSTAAPTQDVNVVLTSVVGTMVDSFFETQTAMYTPPSPTFTETQTPPPTFTPYDTPTPFPTLTPTYYIYLSPTGSLVPTGTGTHVTATLDPILLGSGCNNLAFIRDVTVPPGTVFQPKEDFIKTWKVQNTGSCPWLYQYRLALLSGDDFGAGDTKIQKKVEVNSWTELSLNLSAPKTEGTYKSYWRLADADGNMFGATLTVSIVVKK